ncbi:unnamed protein product [Pedinophyceae sp. YPF-701]|nr:unnamed protein product [Pedinophyceae sp. YPF-701]
MGSPRPHGARKREIFAERLSEVFHLPLDDASRQLGVGKTLLKQLCRSKNITRWPARKIARLVNLKEDLEALEDLQNSSVATYLAEVTVSLEKLRLDPAKADIVDLDEVRMFIQGLSSSRRVRNKARGPARKDVRRRSGKPKRPAAPAARKPSVVKSERAPDGVEPPERATTAPAAAPLPARRASSPRGPAELDTRHSLPVAPKMSEDPSLTLTANGDAGCIGAADDVHDLSDIMSMVNTSFVPDKALRFSEGLLDFGMPGATHAHPHSST